MKTTPWGTSVWIGGGITYPHRRERIQGACGETISSTWALQNHHWMNPPFTLQAGYQEWNASPLLVGVKVYRYSFNVSLWSTYRNDGLFLILLMTLCYEDVERLNWHSVGYPEGRAAFTSYSNVLKVNCHEGILKLSFRILWVHGAKQPTQNQRNSPIRVWHPLLNPR